MGLLDRLFRSRESETPDEDPRETEESEDQRPYPVELVDESWQYDETLSTTFTRTVELVTYVGGETMLIEYDEKSSGTYRGCTGVDTRSGRYNYPHMTAEFGEELVSVNEDNVLHRQELGSYTVELERDATIETNAKIVKNPGDIPDDCTTASGRPKADPYNHPYEDHHKNFVVSERGNILSGGRGRSFAWISIDDGSYEEYAHNGRILVYNRTTYNKEWASDTRREAYGSTGEIIADAVETGTNVMRAVLADGRVVIPDGEDGLDEESSDLIRIANLASRND